MRPWHSTHAIIPRRPAVCLVAIALVAALSLSIAGCGGGGGGSQATPGSTVAAGSEPTSAPTPQDRRPWSYQGQRGITAAFAPADLALYRSLLPAAFDMPDQPLVVMSVVDYYDVTSPLVRYREGFVGLQCKYQGRTAWHIITMPVDDATSNAGGRSIGFPKYVADKITLDEQAGGWTGRVVKDGRAVMEVVFTATGSAAPAPQAESPVTFQPEPPGQGPTILEVDTVALGERHTVTTAGSATVSADAGEPWAGLLGPAGTVVWGSFDEVTGNWWLEPKQLQGTQPQTTPGATTEERRPWSTQGQRGITAAFVPADLGLYRSLLPEAFDMPDQPLVAVSVLDNYDVTSPFKPYHEAYVTLQCKYQGRTGWHVITLPVDDATASGGAGSIGFPAYVADKITLEEQAGGWTGRVVKDGHTVMEVVFTAKGSAAPAPQAESPVTFQLQPPGQGPTVLEDDTVASGERQTVTTPGSATVSADAGEPWAGLLGPAGSAVYGTFDDITGDWWMETTQLK